MQILLVSWKEEFLHISNAICQLFPGEVRQSYYIAAENSHQAKGKLRDAFNACRTKLAKAGIITRQTRKSKSIVDAEQNNSKYKTTNHRHTFIQNLYFINFFTVEEENIKETDLGKH